MLILTRRPGESLSIGDEIEITVTQVNGEQAKLGITAPREVPVERTEIVGTPRSRSTVSSEREAEPASEGPRIEYRRRRRRPRQDP